MDIEWAKDGKSGQLFIVQARPETVHFKKQKDIYYEHRLQKTGNVLIKGTAVGMKITNGRVRVIKNVKELRSFKKGEILVAKITDPDWEPVMKIASAIITDKGGRTSHAAIVSRELGIPSIVGTGDATKKLHSGDQVTVDCSSGKEGIIYERKLPFKVIQHKLNKIPKTKTRVMVNISSPEEALKNFYLPVQGVGLGRLEFIISSYIGIHPNALINFSKLKKQTDLSVRRLIKAIEKQTAGYNNKTKFYIDKLTEGIAKIAAAFWPWEVIIRFSDFKSNEYRALKGGFLYEPREANPMIGWRGASRYYSRMFQKSFGLECLAVKKAREEIGLENISVMVPFCCTPEEGEKVMKIMKKYGLEKNNLKIYAMCELPSNIIQAKEFLDLFDGLSIGSNDLTQLILSIDRDNENLTGIGNENSKAVRLMIKEVIASARKRKKYIGICGQAPSDFPDFTAFLVNQGISSISLNPMSVIKTLPVIAKAEARFSQRSKIKAKL